MRQALIYNQDQLAGLLTEDENGYTFQYDTAYIKSSDAESISLTLPISEKPYTSLILFPFFDGLISCKAGFLDIAEKSWKIKSTVTVCHYCLPVAKIASVQLE